MNMNMENPNKDLVRFIDAILREMEVAKNPDEIKISNLNLPLPSNYQNLIKQNKLLLKLKEGAAEDSEILGFRELPLFYIIKKPNRKKLLEIRKRLTEFKEVDGLPSEKTDKKESKITTLYLNSVGDLWREPKDKFCYPMGETSDRHKIVRYLVTNKGYQQTSQISMALMEKSKQTIRQEKRKINENFRKRLKIKTDDLIEGRQGSGYRINPGYKILPKDD